MFHDTIVHRSGLEQILLNFWLRYHFGMGTGSFFKSLPSTLGDVIINNNYKDSEDDNSSNGGDGNSGQRGGGGAGVGRRRRTNMPRTTRLTNLDFIIAMIINDFRPLTAFGFDANLHIYRCSKLLYSHEEYFDRNGIYGFYHFGPGNTMAFPMHKHPASNGHGRVSFVIATYGKKTWAVAPDYTTFCPQVVPGTTISSESTFTAFNYNPFFPWLCRQNNNNGRGTKKSLGWSHTVQPMQLMFIPSDHSHTIYTPEGGGIGALLQVPTKAFESTVLPNIYNDKNS